MDLIEAFNVLNIKEGLKNYDDGAIDFMDGTGAPLKSKDSIEKLIVQFFNVFSNFKSENVHISADGDWVMVWATWSGTWTKDFEGQKPTGKSFKVQDVDVYKFNDEGKIVEHHGIQPFSTIMRQIGMKM